MNRELDEKIARKVMNLQVLGWAYARTYENGWMIIGEGGDQAVYVYQCHCTDFEQFDKEYGLPPAPKVFGHFVYCLAVVPFYSSDPVAVFEMEEKIKELGLMREYGLALARELGLFDDERDMGDLEGRNLFALAHASPEDRCVAALEAVEMQSNRAGKLDHT